MTILGIDTSLRSTGYGVINAVGNKLNAVDYGTIKNGKTLTLSQCLKNISEKITAILDSYSPDVIAIESVIYGKNANTMLVLGEARGVIIASAALRNIPIYEYEPRRMKRSVCGNAMAEKDQIQRMVKTLLSLEEIPQNDAADALGLAICHTHSTGILSTAKPI
jgi:crossover junction endodeoxyribonuclease RuvC